MPAEAYGVASAETQVRKERVHTTMLIELLALMVFMAMTFSFVQKEEDQRTNPLRAVVEQLKTELAKVRKELADTRRQVVILKRENETLAEANRRLFAQLKGTQPSIDPPVALTKSQLDQLNADLARALEQNKQLGIENARLGGKGVGYPNCLVGGGYYLNVRASPEGYQVSVAAPATANPAPQSVDGLKALTSGGVLSRSEFERRAGVVRRWGLAQGTPCIFSARVHETHSVLSLYKQQTATVGRFFYWGPG